MAETMKRAAIVRSFTDEGSGKSYTAGTFRMIRAGAFANYEAAGLVREPAPRQPRKVRTRAKTKAKTAPAAPASADDRPGA